MQIEWNMKGFEEIRRSEEVQQIVDDATDDLLDGLPRGFVRSSTQGKSRYRNIVFADTSRAFYEQAKYNHLQKRLFEMGGS